MTSKWGFGVAILPVGALCLYQAHFGRAMLLQNGHFGRISSTLYFTVFPSLGGHASARRVTRAVLPPGALFHASAFTFPPFAPKSHLHPLPHLGVSDFIWVGGFLGGSPSLEPLGKARIAACEHSLTMGQPLPYPPAQNDCEDVTIGDEVITYYILKNKVL